MLAFLISHLYLATTGHKIYSQVMAMITGWEDLGHELPSATQVPPTDSVYLPPP
jgi:hypothetical protein